MDDFTVGMKLEAVDVKKFQSAMCVGTIMVVDNDNVHITFLGWSDGYDYKCAKSSVLIRPMGWRERSGQKSSNGKYIDIDNSEFLMLYFEIDVGIGRKPPAPEYLFTPVSHFVTS